MGVGYLRKSLLPLNRRTETCHAIETGASR